MTDEKNGKSGLLKKILATIAVLLAITGGLFALDSRWANEDAVARSLTRLKVEVQRSFQELRNNWKLQRLWDRLQSVNLLLAQYRFMLRKNPGDKLLIAEIKKLREMRDKIKLEIETLLKRGK